MKFVLSTVLIFLVSCASQKPQNAILLISDGMGAAHVTAARYYSKGVTGDLNVDQMPYTAISRTYSTNNFATDSAASGTALATGVKTYNGSIAMSDPQLENDGQSKKLETLVDLAKKEGKSVGVITTTRITHATPACFYAHVPERDMENDIALQLMSSNVDLAMGGGMRHFLSKDKGGKREDGKNLIEEFQQKGWELAQDKSSMLRFVDSSKKVLGLFDMTHMPYQLDRSDDSLPTLEEMVDFSIKYLQRNPKGYLLIVEAGRVDHASHDNQALKAMGEMEEMDKALGRMRNEDSDTLIVLTSDHETGGLAINGYGPHSLASGLNLFQNKAADQKKKIDELSIITWASGPGAKSSDKADVKQKFFEHKAAHGAESAFHSAVDVQIFAAGPGSEIFHGVMNNSDIPQKISTILDL